MSKPTTITVCVYVEAPRCPACESRKIRVYKSVGNQGDDSSLQYCFCRECSYKFKVIAE